MGVYFTLNRTIPSSEWLKREIFNNIASISNIGILKKLLDHDFIVHLVNNVESKNSRSPLFLAAMYNFVDVAKVLLEHGGNMTEVDGSNRSPLYIAAEKGRAGLLDLFLKHGKMFLFCCTLL